VSQHSCTQGQILTDLSLSESTLQHVSGNGLFTLPHVSGTLNMAVEKNVDAMREACQNDAKQAVWACDVCLGWFCEEEVRACDVCTGCFCEACLNDAKEAVWACDVCAGCFCEACRSASSSPLYLSLRYCSSLTSKHCKPDTVE
jgi:hypothetical protein